MPRCHTYKSTVKYKCTFFFFKWGLPRCHTYICIVQLIRNKNQRGSRRGSGGGYDRGQMGGGTGGRGSAEISHLQNRSVYMFKEH